MSKEDKRTKWLHPPVIYKQNSTPLINPLLKLADLLDLNTDLLRIHRFCKIFNFRNLNHCYNIPTAESRRSAGIGYGRRSDFTGSVQANPAPNAYRNYTDFHKDKPFTPAWTMGLSREAFTKLPIEGHFIADPSVPGPGSYNTQKVFAKDGTKYTMRPKTRNVDSFNTSLKTPGPAAYKPKYDMADKGEYFVSKFKNSGACKISPNRQDRFSQLAKQNASFPGPGQYAPRLEMKSNGQYYLKFKSSQARSFSQDKRKDLSDTGHTSRYTPGPGTYRAPSEFGYYDVPYRNKAMTARENNTDRSMNKSYSVVAVQNNEKNVNKSFA